MTTRRFSLDANVLVYAADRRAAARHERALEILDRAPRRDCILTVQALAEFFHATTRKGLVPKADAAAQVHDWSLEFPVAAADLDALRAALDSRSMAGSVSGMLCSRYGRTPWLCRPAE